MNYVKETLNNKIYNFIDKHYKDWFQVKYKDNASIIVEINDHDVLEFNFDNCGESFDVYNHVEYRNQIVIYIDNILREDYHSIINNVFYISALSSFTGIYNDIL